MKEELQILLKDLEARIKVQRDLMIWFSELKDEETANKLRILTNGYCHCLMAIKGIIHNK